MLLNTVVQGLVLVLSLDPVPSVHDRFMVHDLQVALLARGCPVQWGLPDKCPRGHTGEMTG